MELVVEKYKQTEVGLIPNDWDVKELGQVIDLITGFPFPSSGYSESGIRLLRCSNVKRGVTDWSEDIVQYWSKITPELKPYILNEGDIVIAMDGSLVGRSFARLAKSDLPAILLQRVARIRSNKIDVGYLKEFVCSDYFTKYSDTVKTSSAIPHISPSDIRGFKIPIPHTKAEQTAIAIALSDADALISSLEKLIAKKRNIKQGAMQKLLQPKEGWEVKKLGDVGDIVTGSTPPTQIKEYWNGSIPWITPTDILNNQKDIFHSEREITNTGLQVIRKLPANTLLVTCIASIGKNAILRNDGACNQQINAIIPNSENNVDYLYFLIENSKSYLIGKAGTTATMMISKKEFSGITFCFPAYEEQTSIATILSDMDAEINALETKLEKYRKVKLGMMQNLLTGKIRLV